jgi:DNA-binding transcriptional regulator YiaG
VDASMAAIYANINPDIVGWARQRSHLSASRLAKSLGIPEEKLAKWERGEKFPTLKTGSKYRI